MWKPKISDFKPLMEQCDGCKRIVTDDRLEWEGQQRCAAYINPKAKWRVGKHCPLCSTIVHTVEQQGKVRLGQQKQKKRKH